MKKPNCIFILLLVAAMLLSSCGTLGSLNSDSMQGGNLQNGNGNSIDGNNDNDNDNDNR